MNILVMFKFDAPESPDLTIFDLIKLQKIDAELYRRVILAMVDEHKSGTIDYNLFEEFNENKKHDDCVIPFNDALIKDFVTLYIE